MWRRWKLGCYLAAIGGLVAVMACVLAGAAIKSRVVAPPEVHLHLGPYRLAAYTTNRPECTPYGGRKPSPAVPCSTESLFAPYDFYTVWLLVQTDRGRIRYEEGRLLFLLPLN